MKPVRIENKLPDFPKEKSEQFSSIMDGFSKNASSRFDDPQLSLHIDRIEAIYIESGRYLELTKLYEDEYKKKGKDAKMVDRLAFAYIRLGQNKAARDLLDVIGKARPESAHLHFLEGSFWMRQPRSLPNLTNALRAWLKVLELDPNYVGFEGMDKRTIQPIIDQLRRVVPASALEKKPEIAPEQVAENADKTSGDVNVPSQPEKGVEVDIKKSDDVPKVSSIDPKPEEPAAEIEKVIVPEMPKVIERSADEKYLLKIAMAEIAIAEGDFEQGERFYKEAKILNPNGFEAEFGPIRARWRFEPARNKLSVAVRTLAKKKLNAKQAYQVGLFVYSNMSAKKLARDLFMSVREQDPVFAKEVGLEALLAEVK